MTPASHFLVFILKLISLCDKMYRHLRGYIMEKDKIINTIVADYAMMFSEALMLWEKQPKKSFLTCWTQVVQDGGFLEFYAPGGEKKIKKSKNYARELLRESGEQLADFVSAQAFLYATEFIKNNIDKFPDDQQALFDEIKRKIIHTNNNDIPSGNEERLLRGIRNSFAHNNDENLPRVEYDLNNKQFIIHIGKGDDTIVLGKIEMFKLLEIYTKHVHEWKSSKYGVIPSMAIYFPSDKPSKEIITLIDRDKKGSVEPDEYQTEVLDGIVDRVRQGKFAPGWNDWILGLFYPYKNSSSNNSAKMSVLSIYLKDLIDLKDFDLQGFSQRCRSNKYTALNDYTCPTDDVSLFMSNILFILCTNTINEILQECIDGISNINMSRVRNAVAHGTFFHDKKLGFHFYDGVEKTEESLDYVGYLSFEDIIKLKDNIAEKKFAEYSDDAKITLGTSFRPEPHVKE